MSDHPRDRFDLAPHQEAERAFTDALSRGRLHHAWMLTGVEGVGKATFAYRAARRLLGAEPDPSRGELGARPMDPVSQLVSAQSHPDLMILERAGEGAKLKRNISVDQARELPEFFSMSPSRARYRVAIIDAADDLNMNAANALLKVLEEPPERGVLFLVTHAPGRLLPTIRSRCRRLNFPNWSVEALGALVSRQTGLADQEAGRIAAMAAGSPGAALMLAGDQMLELDRLARGWVDEDQGDVAAQIAQSAKFRGADGAENFERLFDRLLAAVKDRAASSTGREAAAWSETWSRLSVMPDQVSGINLDRADVLAAAMAEIGRARRIGAV
ncbi:MAG: DNA polymerase III subunit delta' [Brevundimonas sp.]